MIMMKRSWRVLGYVSTAVVLAALTGCSSAPLKGRPSTVEKRTGSSQASAPATKSVQSDDKRLRAAAVRGSDLSHHLLVRPAPGGNTVHDEVTLDNCGYHFSSENNRVARHQLEIIDRSDPRVRFGNELVSYRTPTQARQALAQWHRSVVTCPHGYRRSSVAIERPMRYDVLHDTIDSSSVPVHHNEITTESARPRTGRELWLTAIYQTRGRYLDAIYLDAEHAPTTLDENVARALAEATGRRLLKVTN